MANTPIRTVRVPDKTWEKAKQVAHNNDTTVSEMINEFLSGLRWHYRPGVTAKRAANRVAPIATLGRPLPPERAAKARAGAQPVKAKPAVDKATCTHLKTKKIPYGHFCMECGSRLP